MQIINIETAIGVVVRLVGRRGRLSQSHDQANAIAIKALRANGRAYRTQLDLDPPLGAADDKRVGSQIRCHHSSICAPRTRHTSCCRRCRQQLANTNRHIKLDALNVR